MTITEDAPVVTEQVSGLDYLDEQIGLCLHRGYFDLKEIEEVFGELELRGMYKYDIAGPIVDWTRERIYCSSEKFMNALLDIRNTYAPPTTEDANE